MKKSVILFLYIFLGSMVFGHDVNEPDARLKVIKFTKDAPIELEKTVCAINALIDVLKLDIEKPTKASSSHINKALIDIGYGYKLSYDTKQQWIQLVDIIGKMGLNDQTVKDIEKLASEKYEHLKKTKEVI